MMIVKQLRRDASGLFAVAVYARILRCCLTRRTYSEAYGSCRIATSTFKRYVDCLDRAGLLKVELVPLKYSGNCAGRMELSNRPRRRLKRFYVATDRGRLFMEKAEELLSAWG